MSNTVITIGREYGSGGRLIGKQLAQALGYSFLDKELITLAAQKSGMSAQLFADIDENATNSLLYSLASGAYMMGSRMAPGSDMPMTDKLFILQSNIIREEAEKGPCVVVGRCGDYVMEGRKSVYNIFIQAPFEDRVKRAVAEYGLEEKGAADAVRRTDKKRANYYNYYSNRKWGRSSNYHLCVDSSKLGIDGTVQLLTQFIHLALAHEKHE